MPIQKISKRVKTLKEITDFGFKLKSLRELKGESQTDIARILEVSPQMVSKLENGKSQPTATTLKILAGHFGITVDEILGMKNHGYSKKESLPIIGRIAAGEPIFAKQNVLGYYPVLPGEKGEFYLKVDGDSMEPTIQDGSLVLVKKISKVDTGEICVVILNNSFGVLKRIYFDPYGVILRSDNNKYEPIFINRERWENESVLVGVVTLVVKSMRSS